jgi:two-component system, LytTR family, sensor kinase
VKTLVRPHVGVWDSERLGMPGSDRLAAFERRPARFRRFEAGLVLGWWTVYAIWMTLQYLAVYAGQITFAAAASRGVMGAVVWAVITFIAFALSRRFRIDRKPRALAVVVHTLAGAVLASCEVVAAYYGMELLGWGTDASFAEMFLGVYPSNILFYWLFVGVGHGLEYYRFYRQRDSQAAQLAARLARSELEMLKSQLHPHFLFNTLHAISALMHRDVKAADRMIARLSELLRVSLDYSGTQEVSLQEELAFLEPYVEIERVRLGERLTVEYDIQPGVLDACVPHMLLQPLVENAIRHGIAPRAQPGSIRIRARGRRDMLDIEVVDDGRGMPPGRSANGGVGLANTRARLEQLYGDDFNFEPRNAAGGGFRVALTIPYRPIDVARSAEQPAEPGEEEEP